MKGESCDPDNKDEQVCLKRVESEGTESRAVITVL